MKQNNNSRNQTKNRGKRRQPRKDNSQKRVNYDNTREDKFKRDIEKDAVKPEGNDSSWYFRNPTLAKSAATMSFGQILGTGYGQRGSTVPGILQIAWVPSVGAPDNMTAINQAAKSMYSFIIHANSRNLSYTAPDQMMLVVAGMQVFSIIGAAIRAYGLAHTYVEENSYYADGLLKAAGFEPDDFREHLPQIWFDINYFIDQTRQIWLPNTLPLMERWYWLNTTAFKDADTSTAQTIMYTQCVYWELEETLFKTGTSLAPAKYTDESGTEQTFAPGGGDTGITYKWSIWSQVIQRMIDALINSEDRGIIYGDILKAYGKENLYALSPIEVDYKLAPVYNMEVLMETENIASCRWAWCGGICQVEEEIHPTWHGYIGVSQNQDMCIDDSILNFHFESDPTPEMVMTATRLVVLGTINGKFYNGQAENDMPKKVQMMLPRVCGTEIPFALRIITKIDSGIHIQQVSQFVDNDPANASSHPRTVIGPLHLDMMAFDWHPFLYYGQYLPATLPTGNEQFYPELIQAYGDFDKYVQLSRSVAKRLHDVALFSLWGVPHI